MFRYLACMTLLISISTQISAESVWSGNGKIVFTEGRATPACRQVSHKATETGVEKIFRISDTAGDDDINSIILAALIADRDVNISYDPEITTGCGTEPKIIYARVY